MMSPRSKQQFEELRASSTAKILSAALELFGTIGFQATTISRIAEKAGVSKGLIYNYFDSKEALLKTMIEELAKEGDKVMTISKSDDPTAMLESMIRGAIGWLRDHEKQNRLIMSLITQVDQFDFVQEMANTKMIEFLEILSDLLKKINFPNYRTEARILATLFDGIGMQYLVLKQDYPLDEIEEMLVVRYCRPKKMDE
ncbi:MAG: TetR/AcrR family transcriptional regulator [Cyclobacteriaceae bacterium]